MTFADYANKFPLKKTGYTSQDVQIIRRHAFLAGTPEKKETRSQKQNRYMFGVVYKLISEYTGYTTSEWNEELNWVIGLDKDEVHAEMGKMFLSYEKNGRQYVFSTTKLNTKEMEIYLENIRRWASAELGLYIALPNESDCPCDIN